MCFFFYIYVEHLLLILCYIVLKWIKVVIGSAILKYMFLKKNILIVSDCLKIDSDIYIGIFRTICWMP